MTEFIKPILDFLKQTVDRWGVKFLVALGGVYAIYDLTLKGFIEGKWAVIGIAVVMVAFFAFRHFEAIKKSNGGTK